MSGRGTNAEAVRHAGHQLSSVMDDLVAEDTERSREAATAIEDALDLLDSAIRTLETDDPDFSDEDDEEEDEEEPPRVEDLMASLEASLAAAKRTLRSIRAES